MAVVVVWRGFDVDDCLKWMLALLLLQLRVVGFWLVLEVDGY